MLKKTPSLKGFFVLNLICITKLDLYLYILIDIHKVLIGEFSALLSMLKFIGRYYILTPISHDKNIVAKLKLGINQ